MLALAGVFQVPLEEFGRSCPRSEVGFRFLDIGSEQMCCESSLTGGYLVFSTMLAFFGMFKLVCLKLRENWMIFRGCLV